ncbi:hypothetical protein AB0J72_41320 [Dactylosporangium sp. NPDC049742]|uniref:hypothetical protein n=1 Tax=Dactylosporangium sp. NPDC049742 TaxID=3154737 RepID=UPI0034377D9D
MPRWAAATVLDTSAVALLGAYLPLDSVVGTAAWAAATAGFTGCAAELLRARRITG